MENAENKTIELKENKPKRKVLKKRIEELESELLKAKKQIENNEWTIRCRERDCDRYKNEIQSLKAYIAGIKGDAFPVDE